MENHQDNEHALTRRDFLRLSALSASSLVLPWESLHAKQPSFRERIAPRNELERKLCSTVENYADESMAEEIFETAKRMLTTDYRIFLGERKRPLNEIFSEISKFRDYINQNGYLTVGKKTLPIQNLATALIAQESGGDILAKSDKGARGLTQLMPDTARELLGIRVNSYVDYRLDVEENIRGGLTYLKQQLDKYKDGVLGLIAYHSGPGAVRGLQNKKWKILKKYLGENAREYVPKVLALKVILDANLVGFQNADFYSTFISNSSTTWQQRTDIDLRKVSKNSGMPLRVVKYFNPHVLGNIVPKFEIYRVPVEREYKNIIKHLNARQFS